MHYDHVGNFHRFPEARFHLQEPEIHYAVGRYMKHRQLARSFEPDDVCGVVRLNFDGRVVYRTGPGEVAPGISVVPTGGHSVGLQFVKVNTRRGVVVLASDVTHFYENMETGRPFTTAFNIGEMLDAYRRAARTRAVAAAHRAGTRSRGHASLSAAAAGAGGCCRAAGCGASGIDAHSHCQAQRGSDRSRDRNCFTALATTVVRSLRHEVRTILRKASDRLSWTLANFGLTWVESNVIERRIRG